MSDTEPRTPTAATPGTPVLNIVGRKVALGPLRHEDLPRYERWINDFEGMRGLKFIRPLTSEAEAAWYERTRQTDNRIDFAIYIRDGLRAIGTAGLLYIDHQHGTAEFGILIGERDCRGHGYGAEATQLVLDYAFNILSLHNVMLRVYSYNEQAIRAYKRAGFREVGRRREAQPVAGRRYDELIMDCLATEFSSPAVKGWFPEAQSD